MKKPIWGLTKILVKGFHPTEASIVGAVVQKTINNLVYGVAPVIDREEIWIDFRCTQGEFEVVKYTIEKDLKQFSDVYAVIHFEE